MTNLKTPTLDALKQFLHPLGYRKKAGLFSRELKDVVHLVEVQGSRHSTSAQAVFTVNLGIFVPELVYPDVREATKPSIPGGHWMQRLGVLCPENQDLWWKPETPEQALEAADDILNRLRLFGIPVLEALPNAVSLVELWKSGRSPGLTERQRAKFLVALGQV
ncbi:DUF4304 domain-containing protein [Variovorax sp. MHTC-1]|uniref:DUF4304 domain-containing protein n=1 Tax=Variovorax sp. MHTC-1 TaxID=2495593 RepID=UPI000F88FC9E|nr:DUF4304 domain-containing protein [Variovorax sp. MHTC-1]RST48493.1 DUF4304 domain-containing protein [Variovorax sp. MHTC-1]